MGLTPIRAVLVFHRPRQVRPGSSVQRAVESVLRHSERAGGGGGIESAPLHCSQLHDQGFGKSVATVGFASLLSTARQLVGDVVGIRANRQVPGIHAARIIAGVQDVHSIRDRPVGQLPCGTVSGYEATSDANLAVALCGRGAGPFPATWPAIGPSGNPLGKRRMTTATNLAHDKKHSTVTS